MNKIKVIGRLFLSLVLLGIPEIISSQPGEYMMKGIFLEKFTRFIEWPESAGIEDTSKPFVVRVIGKNPFNGLLDQLYKNQKIKNKKVQIEYIDNPEEIDDCNLLFIPSSERARISEILEKTKDKPILTVGESELISGKGVIINLRLSNRKIRFEIDEKAAHGSQLYVSHLLLKEAILIDTSEDRK